MLTKIRTFLFDDHSTTQRVAKNTVWLFLGEFFGRVIRFSIVVYATRLLGPSEYGIFAYVMAINAFLVIFSDIGLSAILTRETVRRPEDRDKYISSAFFLKLILTAVNIGILLFIVPAFTKIEGALVLLPLVTFILIFDSLREFAFGLNRAFERMDREAFARIVLNIAIALIGFFLLLQNASAKFLIIAYILGSLIGTLLIFTLIRKHIARLFKTLDASLFIPLLKMAIPIGLLQLLSSITLNTDLVMIGIYRSSAELGYYALAQKIILLLYVIPTLLASAVFPSFIRLAKESKKEFRETLEKVTGLSFLLIIPVTLGGIIVSDQLVSFFGLEFLPTAKTFSILLLSLLIVYPSMIIANALTAYDKQKKFLLFVGIGAIGNIVFNMLLIPKYGIEGAALSSVITQLIANAFVWAVMKKINRFRVLYRLYRVILASLIMGVLAVFLKLSGFGLFAIIVASIILYAMLLFLMREPLIGFSKRYE